MPVVNESHCWRASNTISGTLTIWHFFLILFLVSEPLCWSKKNYHIDKVFKTYPLGKKSFNLTLVVFFTFCIRTQFVGIKTVKFKKIVYTYLFHIWCFWNFVNHFVIVRLTTWASSDSQPICWSDDQVVWTLTRWPEFWPGGLDSDQVS